MKSFTIASVAALFIAQAAAVPTGNLLKRAAITDLDILQFALTVSPFTSNAPIESPCPS